MIRSGFQFLHPPTVFKVNCLGKINAKGIIETENIRFNYPSSWEKIDSDKQGVLFKLGSPEYYMFNNVIHVSNMALSTYIDFSKNNAKKDLMLEPIMEKEEDNSWVMTGLIKDNNKLSDQYNSFIRAIIQIII